MRLIPALALILSFALPGAARACEGRLIEGPGVFAAPLCIPATVQRIAVADPTFSLGMALELGLPVVAAPLSGMSDAALQARAEAAGVVDIGSVLQPSIEAVVAAAPDLILGSVMLESLYPMLSQIAPTVLITDSDWRDYYRTLARVTGREAALDDLLAPLGARIAALRPRIPDSTVSILRITPWDFQVYPDAPGTWAPFALLRELGLRRAPYETRPDPAVLRPDWEELAGLTGDRLLYIIGGMNDSASSGRWQEVSGNPLWQLLPAVRAGRVAPLDPAVWMEFSGIAAAHRVLDDVERLILP